jgi:hypothetical protein
MQLSILKIIPFCIVFFVFSFCNKKALGEERKIQIKEVQINDEKTIWSQLSMANLLKYKKLNELGVPDGLVVNYDINSISFKIKITNNQETKFRYKLTGCENHWNYLDSCQWIRYVNLKHGKYTFQLQALVNNTIVEESKFDFSKNLNKKYLSADFLMLFTTFLLILVTIKMK